MDNFGKKGTVFCALNAVVFLVLGCSSSPSTETVSTREAVSSADVWTGEVATETATRNRPVVGTKGMVSADDRVAAEWGAEVLRQGGNAVDAAVATAFALAVTRPHYGSLGGGGFMVYCPASSSENRPECMVVDYRETAPAEATRDMYIRDGKGDTNLSQDGALAPGVPGVTAGLLLALEKFGRLPRQKILSRPIQLAKQGVVMSGHMEAAALERWSAMNESGKALLTCDREKRQPCPPGSVIKQAELAQVLSAISTKGRAGFYEGNVAQKISKGIQAAGGIISMNDLEGYTPQLRKPLVGNYRGWEVITMPPPSAGGAIILQLLEMMEHADRMQAFQEGWGSKRAIHTVAHGMSLGFADRAHHFGDPDFVRVPIDQLLSPFYIKNRWESTYRKDRANPPLGGGLQANEGENTTHFSVVDRWGNAVAVTTTVNDDFGSGFVPPGTGVFMNNEMDDFSIQPGVPNLFGLVGTEANAIAPGKRPLSSMSPTIVRDPGGQNRIVIGAQGGPRITTSVFQALFYRLRFGLSIIDAVHQPRIHQQWRPTTLFMERGGFAPEVRAGLSEMGWGIQEVAALGKMHAIERFPNGRTWGVSDPRTEGDAVAE